VQFLTAGAGRSQIPGEGTLWKHQGPDWEDGRQQQPDASHEILVEAAVPQSNF